MSPSADTAACINIWSCLGALAAVSSSFLALGSRSEFGPTQRLFAQIEKLPMERFLLLEWNAAHDAEQFAAFGNVGLHQLRGLQQGVTFGFGQRRTFLQLRKGLDDR